MSNHSNVAHHLLNGKQYYVNGRNFDQSKKVAEEMVKGKFNIQGNEVVSQSTAARVATLEEISDEKSFDFQNSFFGQDVRVDIQNLVKDPNI